LEYFLLDSNNIFQNSLFVSCGGLFIISSILVFGRKLNFAIKLERIGFPIAVLCGILGIFIGPYGLFNLLSEETTDIWEASLTPLLSLVFATLMLGRPVPTLKGLIKPVLNQFLLALSLGFGQFFVGGLVVKYFLSQSIQVNPLMSCLIEVGFEGGHGAASIMGANFTKMGYPEGLDLSFAMATMGLLSSSLIGSIFIFVGNILNLTNQKNIPEKIYSNEIIYKFKLLSDIKILVINLGLAGLAIIIGLLLNQTLRSISFFLGSFSKEIIYSLPVFPLILIGSLLVRYLLEKTEKTTFISQILQREMGILSTDLLIFAAMASLNLSTVLGNWFPILLLTIFGLVWNILCISFYAYFVFDEYWYEKSLAEFGNSTGVVASGLLLLRLADPNNISKTLPIFTSKQLFAQLLLSGGLFTVLSPILLSIIGLDYWIEICAILAFIISFIAFFINNKITIFK